MKVFSLFTAVIILCCISSYAQVNRDDGDLILDRLEELYSTSQLELKIIRHYDNPITYATAQKISEQYYRIDLHGGYFTSPLMNSDALLLIACHEIGHLFGGSPYKESPEFDEGASVEGQADYFATNSCMKSYFKNFDHYNQLNNNDFTIETQNICSEQYQINSSEFKTCQRSILAAIALQKTHSGSKLSISLKNNNLSTVEKTLEKHPSPQCRLKTYIAGSLCDRENCNTGKYQRPSCWYKEDIKQSLSTRINQLIKTKNENLYNCHGTILFVLGQRDLPLMSFDHLGSYLHNQCSSNYESRAINIVQVYENQSNGSMPLHSFIKFDDDSTFSKSGPDEEKPRFLTYKDELETYSIKKDCQNIDENEAQNLGCVRYTKDFYCPRTEKLYKQSNFLTHYFSKAELNKSLIHKVNEFNSLIPKLPSTENLSVETLTSIKGILNGKNLTEKLLDTFIRQLYLDYLDKGTTLEFLYKEFSTFYSRNNVPKRNISRAIEIQKSISDIKMTIEWTSEAYK